MKRKRFIKLAMSYGVQRNEAERLAKTVCILGSYEAVFAHYRLYLQGTRATRGLRRLYVSVVRAMRPVAQQFRKFLGSIDWAGLMAAEDECGEDRGKEL